MYIDVMNIVLVSIGNFQEYILSNLRQLIRLGHTSIYVITNQEYEFHFAEFGKKVTCIFYHLLQDDFEYHKHTQIDKMFRNGFTMFTSSRFFYLYAFMKQYNIENVLHLENDVPIYYHTDVLEQKIDKQYMYIPVDSYHRAIASIVYIPHHMILGNVLAHYSFEQNDMTNFSMLSNRFPQWIKTLPIASSSMVKTEEQTYVTKNWDQFQMIFDAAAIGQYLGGVDPRNISGNSQGFVNDTCVIKYNEYGFRWSNSFGDKVTCRVSNEEACSPLPKDTNEDGILRPFLVNGGFMIPIFNLHIHCKNVDNFTG